jgi:cathepsin D
MKVNGQSVSLPNTAQASYSAIDTGTTLIGGPPEAIKAIFADIPGSAPGTGDYEGYYTYPCDSKVQLSLTFGSGTAWNVAPDDFMLTQLSSKQCVGALFSLDSSGNGGPSWIMGDTFLVCYLHTGYLDLLIALFRKMYIPSFDKTHQALALLLFQMRQLS